MAKFCLSCGDALGSRQLMHDAGTCDRCRERAALAKPRKAASGLRQFLASHPLANTGKPEPPGDGPA